MVWWPCLRKIRRERMCVCARRGTSYRAAARYVKCLWKGDGVWQRMQMVGSDAIDWHGGADEKITQAILINWQSTSFLVKSYSRECFFASKKQEVSLFVVCVCVCVHVYVLLLDVLEEIVGSIAWHIPSQSDIVYAFVRVSLMHGCGWCCCVGRFIYSATTTLQTLNPSANVSFSRHSLQQKVKKKAGEGNLFVDLRVCCW